MALNYNTGNFSKQFNSTYNIVLDVSSYQKTTVQVVGAMGGRINIHGSNDGGVVLATQQGSPETATNFVPIKATNLTTGTTVDAIYGAGLFSIDINAQYLRLQGSPASAGTFVYKLILNNFKTI